MKQCTRCKTQKDTSEFYEAKRYKDGLFSICKQCQIDKTRQWQQENEDLFKEKQKIWKTPKTGISRSSTVN